MLVREPPHGDKKTERMKERKKERERESERDINMEEGRGAEQGHLGEKMQRKRKKDESVERKGDCGDREDEKKDKRDDSNSPCVETEGTERRGD